MPVTLMRHAHTDWNGPPRRFQGRADVPLSEAGVAEAQRIGRAMIAPAHVVSSPARRCIETLDNLFAGSVAPDRIDPRLWEIDVGRHAGRLHEEVAESDAEEMRLWRAAPSRVRLGGGETLAELQRRVVAGLRDAVGAADTDADLLIVTHGGPIRVLRCFLDRAPLDAIWEVEVGNLSRVTLSAQDEATLYAAEAEETHA